MSDNTQEVKNEEMMEAVNEVNRGIIESFENGEFDILINFSDCLGLFNDGFSKEVLSHYPQVKLNDDKYGANFNEDPLQGAKGRSTKRLGTYMVTDVQRKCGKKGQIFTCYIKYFNTIVNEMHPFSHGKDQLKLTNQSPVKYPAIYKAFKTIMNRVQGKKIGIPAIRGANKEFARDIITGIFVNHNPNGNEAVFLNFDKDPRFSTKKPKDKNSDKTKSTEKSNTKTVKEMVDELNQKWNGTN